jgi:aminomethyltransferase
MTQTTPLYQSHIDAGGKLVEFSGWQLPIHYGSLIAEHTAVREQVGMFDVSHMTIVDISGPDAFVLLQKLLSNDVGKLTAQGEALYSCMLNEQGGIIDDLIVYFMQPQRYRLVVNAATRVKDLEWINTQSESFDVVVEEQPELAMIAVQGPTSLNALQTALSAFLAGNTASNAASVCEQVASLPRYHACELQALFIAATGYTGELGYEIALPAGQAAQLWQCLIDAGVQPCGLGARDTLRLEAGMSLYGSDMDESNTPYSSALGWTVAWQPLERQFNGREALADEHAHGATQKLCGIVLDEKGVLRGGQLLYQGDQSIGVITSGTFSPTLKKSIAFGRIEATHSGDCTVQIRQNRLPVRITGRVFVRHGTPA